MTTSLLILIVFFAAGLAGAVYHLVGLIRSDGYGRRSSAPRSHYPEPFDPQFRGRVA